MIRLILLISVVACAPTEQVADPPKPADAQAPPKIDSSVPVKLDCKPLEWELDSEVRGAYVAMENWPHYDKAKTLWKSMPPTCRTGRWYLAVARLLDLTKQPLEVDAIRFETAEAALTAALDQPDDVDVLARVAEVAAYGRRVLLPVNACERARAAPKERFRTDAVHYVCARAAIAARDAVVADQELDAIVDHGWSADFELARAQAATLRGDRVGVKRHAAKAIEIVRRRNARVTSADRDAIIHLAGQLQ